MHLSGTILTARDAAHLWLLQKRREEVVPVLARGAIYHCGPVAIKDDGGKWQVCSAGPTTSARMEPYEGRVIKEYDAGIIIGKGGMGRKTLEALAENRAVYLNAMGGLGALYGSVIKDVRGVHMLDEFGIPEALWEIAVEDMPAIVTMDCHGASLHEEVKAASGTVRRSLLGQ